MPANPSEPADVSALHLKIGQLEAQLHESEAACHTQARRIEELEHEVASQEEFLHTMLDNFPGGVAIYRTVREETDALLIEFKYLSREWADTWRRSWEEPWLADYPTTHSVKMDVREFFEEATAVRLWGLVKNREDTANPLEQARNVLKTAVLSKDGSEFWLSMVVFAVEYEGERWSLGFFQDVTEQVEAQEALEASNRQLQASEARFRQLIDEAIQGVSIIGRDGKRLYVNKKLIEMLGYGSLEEMKTI
ncbi:MAG: PAS domain S-box protein, partial [SAR324 cluster bacterium]|nr:PAS domain S-box protein [SAR324 cluster bacterium]